MIFGILTFLLGAISAGMCFLFVTYSSSRPNIAIKIPRWRIAGMILGTLCLLWSAYEGCIMLEGDLARFHKFVWMLVPVTAILSWFYLDFIFSRALGGFLLLAVNLSLHAVFAYNIPLRWLYSIIALIWGIAGLFLLGTPWRWRQLIELSAKNRRTAVLLGVISVISTLIFWLLPLIGTIK